MAKRKHHDKYASKKRSSSLPNDGLSCVYVCYVCKALTNDPKVFISKTNRDISYFVCSNQCYSYRGE